MDIERTKLINNYTERIKRYDSEIKNSYMMIGMNLHEMDFYKYLEGTEYKNIVDYSLIEFGYEKTKTYYLINIYLKFFKSEKEKGLKTYKDFSITQLRYMLDMSDEQLKECDFKMSVRQIKEIKIKKFTRVNNESIENADKLENNNVIKGVFPEKKVEEKQNTLIVSELPKVAPAISETRTIVTETITSQNNDFVPNEYETYKEKYEQNCKDTLKLNIEIEELKYQNSIYKDMFSFIHKELFESVRINNFNNIKDLVYDLNQFKIYDKIPEKIKFMREVI